MARYKDSVCRLCRREGMKLFLKGDRCFSAKCGIERRAYPPGQHGQGRARFSDYGVQLREKQKVKRMYGLMEKQFAATMTKATRMKGRAGENLLILLERRLDNVVYRMGFATSRAEARQLVKHGHFLLNGTKGTIPSMLVKPGAVISVREKSRKVERIAGALETLESRSIPQWVEINKEGFEGTVKALPVRDDVTMPIQEQLIVELYSGKR
jgi:small subunit ribosomal protein S4